MDEAATKCKKLSRARQWLSGPVLVRRDNSSWKPKTHREHVFLCPFRSCRRQSLLPELRPLVAFRRLPTTSKVKNGTPFRTCGSSMFRARMFHELPQPPPSQSDISSRAPQPPSLSRVSWTLTGPFAQGPGTRSWPHPSSLPSTTHRQQVPILRILGLPTRHPRPLPRTAQNTLVSISPIHLWASIICHGFRCRDIACAICGDARAQLQRRNSSFVHRRLGRSPV